ncbi:MAG: glycosyltransferase N-terminal domain-containing protein [Verrucomicrobiota bacterium]
MRLIFGLAIYRLLLPLLFVAAFPGWLVKMLRRGGLGTRLGERAAIYAGALKNEPRGAVHLHAVSVGEAMLALKLIHEWRNSAPDLRFVLATGTATGHAVATSAELPGVRVTYAPLDFPGMVRRYLRHFEPSQIVLIEGEAWPNLLLACRRRKIPVSLVNARLSPRSTGRYLRFAAWVRPVFGLLDAIAIQNPGDAAIWQQLGIAADKIHTTGSLKIDPSSGQPPTRRPEFQALLASLTGPGAARPIILAASTHAGEEVWIASAIRDAVPDAVILIAPRHAERRAQVKAELERSDFQVVLRSTLPEAHERPARVSSAITAPSPAICLVIDTTGELRDWTAHADVVIIGKSFLATGGQNPCEAILAAKPVVCGPHMENFEPLASNLLAAHATFPANDPASLGIAIRRALDPHAALAATSRATALLTQHCGATRRIVALLTRS